MSFNDLIAPPVGPTIPSDLFASSLQVTKPKIIKGTVTQLTNISTAVTLNAGAGVVTTVSTTLGAVSEVSFVLSNSFISTTSVVSVSVLNYGGSQGVPNVRVDSVAEGSCLLFIQNGSGAVALNGTITIGFSIV